MQWSYIKKPHVYLFLMSMLLSIGACIAIAFYDSSRSIPKPIPNYGYLPLANTVASAVFSLLFALFVLTGPWDRLRKYRTLALIWQSVIMIFSLEAGILFALTAQNAKMVNANTLANFLKTEILNTNAIIASTVLSFASFLLNFMNIIFWINTQDRLTYGDDK